MDMYENIFAISHDQAHRLRDRPFPVHRCVVGCELKVFLDKAFVVQSVVSRREVLAGCASGARIASLPFRRLKG